MVSTGLITFLIVGSIVGLLSGSAISIKYCIQRKKKEEEEEEEDNKLSRYAYLGIICASICIGASIGMLTHSFTE
jgi:F0F1-type ATP synthase assembly protein I